MQTKAFTSDIHKQVSARLKLIDYADTSLAFLGLESYSVSEIKGQSDISKGYNFEVTFISDDTMAVEEIVDTDATLTIDDPKNSLLSKKIHGKILSAQEFGSVARKKLYKIEIVSPFHYLSLNKRYEIFQAKSVPQIIEEIIAKYKTLLNIEIDIRVDVTTYPIKAQCTQYAQSDFEFITMLCEEEGLVLLQNYESTAPTQLRLCKLSEHPFTSTQTSQCDFNLSKSFVTSLQVQDFYDYRRPSLEMKFATGSQINSPVLQDNETTAQLRASLQEEKLRDTLNPIDESIFKDLQRYAKLDVERGYAQSSFITGHTQELFLNSALHIKLEDVKSNKNIDSIIIFEKYEAHFPNALDEYVDTKQDRYKFEVSFIAVPFEVPYLPPYTINKPRIHSIQTAIVSGKEAKTLEHANEIDVNERGEIRVIFHFDAKKPVSIYVPLSNSFSGDGYGTQFLPRVNSEVIVSFINGDIDRPIITGAIHNGENAHPYNLPSKKTESFIKTQTTPQYKDKEGYNELLFEDRQGEEQLNLRAQKDYTLHILNDSHSHIQNNEKTTIDNDTEVTVANNFIVTVGDESKLRVKGNSITTVEKEQLVSIKENQQNTYEQDYTTIIGKNQTTIVEQELIEEIKGFTSLYVEKDTQQKVLQNLYKKIAKELGIEVSGAYNLNADTIKYKAKTIELEASSGVSLKCGGNALTVDGAGIHLKAPVVDTTSGNGGVVAPGVEMPKEEYDQKLKLVDSTDGTIMANQAYKMTASTGEIVEGITDEKGFTQRIPTADKSTLSIEIIN